MCQERHKAIRIFYRECIEQKPMCMLLYQTFFNMVPVLTVRPVRYPEDRGNTTKIFGQNSIFHGRAPAKYESEARALESPCLVSACYFRSG